MTDSRAADLCMAEPALEVIGVSKRFRIELDRPSSVKEALLRFGRRSVDDFWVLRDISLQVPRGAFFGLIGHNGSGKSTLLRLIAGIHRPTDGKIVTRGRLSTLLELGSGFHPDLTGRENVFLNGAMLRLRRKQIAAVMDDIIGFSGIGEQIDAPVKIYSSGMYVRLGFAVAVHADPEILLIDEVIAVGDAQFKSRCLEHLQHLRDKGTTIVMVSHNTSLIRDSCDQAGWLDHGRLRTVGDPGAVVDAYLRNVADGADSTLTARD